MKKLKKGRKLKRVKSQRKALIEGLARNFFLKERIETTLVRAKEFRSFAEKCITRAKKDDLASKRQLLRYFPKTVVKKLTAEIAPGYKKREGGYTRIIKLPPRKSDGAKMAIIELVK